jgi:hypothetical protein
MNLVAFLPGIACALDLLLSQCVLANAVAEPHAPFFLPLLLGLGATGSVYLFFRKRGRYAPIKSVETTIGFRDGGSMGFHISPPADSKPSANPKQLAKDRGHSKNRRARGS